MSYNSRQYRPPVCQRRKQWIDNEGRPVCPIAEALREMTEADWKAAEPEIVLADKRRKQAKEMQ